MPGGDRTGPAGLGPMTGIAAGYCAGYQVPGYANPIPGRGWFGRGRGRRHWYLATDLPGWARSAYGYPPFGGWADPYLVQPLGPELLPEQEMDILKQEAEFIKTRLEDVQNRIDILKKAEKTSKENK
ncbi:DUF5320 domain-containing protein [candidate division WOR-3 bacterium]|nr:DUF5320 domain-containing protein [candidate division WOR-3 bacterium]